MQTVKFSCDKCGHTHTNRDPEAKRVPLHIVSIHVAGAGQSRTPSAEWCRACCIKAGILAPVTATEQREKPEKAATLEDLIRQIVKQEVGS